jgi:uncharacterized protein YycO
VKAALTLLAAAIMIANIPGQPGDPHCEKWKSGDIVFLNGTSFRSRTVRLLQKYSSDYSHVGIVVVENGVPYVVHADPSDDKVVRQRWADIVARGDISGGAVYRVRGGDDATLAVVVETAGEYARNAIPFDHEFDLKTTDKLYCTELVWRAYKAAGVELCKNAEMEHPHLLPANLLNSSQMEMVLRF